MAIYLNFKLYAEAHGLQAAAKEARILGLDVGEKCVGMALSDTRAVIASPFEYYERKSGQKDAAHFEKVLKSYAISLIIVGLPLNLDGTHSSQATRILAYMEKIHAMLSQTMPHINIIFWDERFSSMAVERAMLQHDMSRKKREHNIDKLAATYILQGALDYRRNRQI
ncbi:MAG: Holliday junction resolvase RuvX [Alphaproteobacteria bacterium]|nr:Holliday junction resolvase RuvX [Alphaproteobacteria bacterium]